MGLELAIDALAELAPAVDAQLVIAGSGPERERLEGHARERGLTHRVTFLGRVADEDLPALYAAGDVCVVPSRQLEGFGYVALEALASGTPVVAAGTGGLAELVGGLEPRWVVAADARSLADAVRPLAAGAAGFPSREERVDYASRMDWTKVLPRVRAVFEQAIAAGGDG
jgi:glycosyltransferase involved in cell wall biosynthesis